MMPEAVNTVEKVFYKDANIRITNSRIVVGNTTYALNNVTKMSHDVLSSGHGKAIAMIIAALFFVVGGFQYAIATYGASLVAVAAGIGIGYWAVKAASEKTWVIRLSTTAGDVNAYRTDNEQLAQSIIKGINNALASKV